MGWKRKLATVKGKKADVSSANDFLFFYNTHALLVFPLNHNKSYLYKCYIKQYSWEMRSTDEKYIQRWAPNGVFCVSDDGHDHVDLLGLVIG